MNTVPRSESKGQIKGLAFLLFLTYMVSYITRINYGAVISEMEKTTGIARNLLSMALTGNFITYGAGQIISGICGDKISPKKLVTCGLITTVAMNLLIPVCRDAYQMLGVWCINGLAQAFMWPPMVKIMTAAFTPEDYKKSALVVSWGGSAGTILIYFIAPLIISHCGWKGVFVFSAVCGAVMIFFWNKYACEIELKPTQKTAEEGKKADIPIFTPLLVSIMASIALHGLIRNGVSTWMPSYISETYDMSNVIAILTGVLLPIFSILCSKAASKLHIKIFTNPLTCAGVLYTVTAVCTVLMYALSGASAAFSIFLAAMITGSLDGVNLMLITMVPSYYKKTGKVSAVSGYLNSSTYIGSAASAYGIALLSEKFGWGVALEVWAICAILGTVICFACIKAWRKNAVKLAINN